VLRSGHGSTPLHVVVRRVAFGLPEAAGRCRANSPILPVSVTRGRYPPQTGFPCDKEVIRNAPTSASCSVASVPTAALLIRPLEFSSSHWSQPKMCTTSHEALQILIDTSRETRQRAHMTRTDGNASSGLNIRSVEVPSLNALWAFEAVARHQNVTRAATELRVAQSAVSRHIRNLEQDLGQRLFTRHATGVTLTAVGETLFREVSTARSILQRVTQSIRDTTDEPMTLFIDVQVTFCSNWLIPRLQGFCEQHPNITPELIMGDGPLAFDKTQADLAIRLAPGDEKPPPGVLRDPLAIDLRYLMASPAVAASDPRMILMTEPLLRHSTARNLWPQLFASLDMNLASARQGPALQHAYMLIAAVKAGLGVAMVPGLVAEEEVSRGDIVRCDVPPVDTGDVYALYCPPQKEFHPGVRAFRRWLIDQFSVTAEASAEV
jgi:LysR family transcriptional regulator, glycine cleavage system transcriptional activator